MHIRNFLKSPIVLRRILGFIILDILMEKNMHGYDIWKELEEKVGSKIPHPIVYRILREFEDMGLVKGEWISSETGPARKVYLITEDGIMVLKHNLNLLKKIRDLLDKIIRNIERHCQNRQ